MKDHTFLIKLTKDNVQVVDGIIKLHLQLIFDYLSQLLLVHVA